MISSGEGDYLPATIGIISLYIFVTCLALPCAPTTNRNPTAANMAPEKSIWHGFSPCMSGLLYSTRILSAIGISYQCIELYSFIDEYKYFTFWNLHLLSIYFLIVLSAQGCRQQFLVEPLYSVVGASTLFITFIDVVLLDDSLTMENLQEHIFPCLAILLEAALNAYSVDLKHCAFYILFILTYLVFIWNYVLSMGTENWPYEFLSMVHPMCMIYYTCLYHMAIVVFVLWHFLSIHKFRMASPQI